jgi:hypothetical protein
LAYKLRVGAASQIKTATTMVGPASAEAPLKLGLAICLLLHERLGFLLRKRLRPPFFFPRVLYAAG